jgi:hypothetical protein
MSTNRWDALLKDYNRAQVIKTGLEIDGPIALRYPKLFINDTPFDLTYAEIDLELGNVINLRDGTRLYLYTGHVSRAYEQEAPLQKPAFTWEGRPLKPIKAADEHDVSIEKSKSAVDAPIRTTSKAVVNSTRRRSIFDQG